MDIDAFTTVHAPSWDRLATLVRRRRLDGREADDMVRLYQEVAAHLSTVRSAAPDPVLVTKLSDLLTRARARISGAHEPAWSDVVRFAVVRVPAALYRIRWWTLGVLLAFLAVALIAGWNVATDPQVRSILGTESQQAQYVNEAFAAYYRQETSFAATVWTNNAWISAQMVAFGISGYWPIVRLWENAVMIGASGGQMAAFGELDTFLTLIAPHGFLELTSVFVAGAAGLRTFWTLIDPGPRRRAVALAQEGRALMTVAVGLAGTLLVAGLIEAFVTGSALPWPVKVAIGAVACAAYWVYVIVLGRRATRAGFTGDLDIDRAGAVVPTAG